MKYNRKNFLRTAGILSSGIALSSFIAKEIETFDAKKIKKFALQLYSLRDDLPKDPKGILKQVSAFGYQQIESYEGKQGMFWGMTALEFKKYMKELDMNVISSHCNINLDFERKAADAASIGMKYLICPWIGPQKTLEEYKRFADQFNKCGSICKKNGIRFAYHNHDYTFKEQDGQFPQDILMKETDPSLVDYEMDIFWVVVAGEDPIAWLKKYSGRFKLSHIKDRHTAGNGKDESCILGEGDIDYKGIAKIAEDNGVDYHVVEQEEYEGTTPLISAEKNAQYMKKLLD